jgi:hypothetical protein
LPPFSDTRSLAATIKLRTFFNIEEILKEKEIYEVVFEADKSLIWNMYWISVRYGDCHNKKRRHQYVDGMAAYFNYWGPGLPPRWHERAIMHCQDAIIPWIPVTNEQGEFVRWTGQIHKKKRKTCRFHRQTSKWKKQFSEIFVILKEIDPKDCRDLCLMFENEFGYDFDSVRADLDEQAQWTRRYKYFWPIKGESVIWEKE